ncbi:SurA N-terminal domain-containing protein [Pseudoroseicyclus aestuarii]|uniref:Parvulin-like PPIase n=1 Tax=Pseudoroseicyclus aestuarii TaxID=1795041 RepID=A0A318SP62_9RHOB|nr:SurA N-terminal domain-containing protein [Pseudoroseicyclus aestuarii]PYE81385.1 peptidyl-prolyl cis-trans isomerase D [Pseudoroseicyclus aestuarii]
MAKRTMNKVLVWVVLALLAVGLVGFGATGVTGTLRTVGTVGDRQITVREYTAALNQQIRAFSEQMGTQLSFPQAQQLGLDQAVLGQLVTEKALAAEAGDLGISAGDARVRDELIGMQSFQDLSGEFDRETYASRLRNAGLTEAEFESGLRDELARGLLQGAVVGGVPEPDAAAEMLVGYLMETRAVTYARLDAAALGIEPEAPDEAAIAAQYEADPEAYTSAESREITYAWLSPEMIQGQVTVDEAQLRELYEQRLADYVQPERRLVERLVYPDEAAATAAKAAIDEGSSDFETAVEDRGLDLIDTDMGDVSEEDLGAAGEAVFAAEPGAVVGPFETNVGPALFRMNAVLAAQEVPFEEAEPELRDELAAARARRVIEDQQTRIEDLLAGGASVEDLAEQTDMELGTINWTPEMTGGEEDDAIAAYAPFREAAAALQEGAYPELMELEDGGIFALRLDAIDPPALQPLEEVRDAVIADALAAATRAAVLADAEARAEGIAGGQSFAEAGLEPEEQPRLTRRDFVEGVPQAFVQTLFEMEEGEVRALPLDPGQVEGAGAVVLRLDGRADPDPADPAVEAERQTVGQRLAAGMAQDLYAAYAGAVQSGTEVRLDEAALQSVNTQFR